MAIEIRINTVVEISQKNWIAETAMAMQLPYCIASSLSELNSKTCDIKRKIHQYYIKTVFNVDLSIGFHYLNRKSWETNSSPDIVKN